MNTAKEPYLLEGIAVSLNTPFDDNDRIDFESLEKLIEFHLDEGARGFLVGAQAGEVHQLTLSERIELIRHVRNMTSGRAELVVGASSRDEKAGLAIAELATESDCDGVLIEVPARPHEQDHQTLALVKAFDSIGMPLLMIQDLDWVGSGLSVELIGELFDSVRSFRSLKVEVTPAGPKYSAVRNITKGRLHLCGGWASQQMIEGLDRGVSVFMPTAMTRLFVQVMNSYRNGDREQATKWFHLLLPVLAFTRQHLDISIQFHKRLFHKRGVFSTSKVRKHSVPYDNFHQQYGDELIAYLDRIEAEAFG
jgi:dihydrodipicolinate synthase/N-acetylneuraminate lyase